MDFPCASKKLSLEMQRLRSGWILSLKHIGVFRQGLQPTSVCVLSQLCLRLRWRAMSAPRLEMVGTAPCWPRPAVEHHRGGRLHGGACPAAAPRALGRSLLQVMLSSQWRFQPLSSPSQENPASFRGISSTPLLHVRSGVTVKENNKWCRIPVF